MDAASHLHDLDDLHERSIPAVPSLGGLPGPLVSADWLAHHLGAGPVVLDATVVLAPAAHDGDFRAESGKGRFVEGHIPGARFADLLGDLSDHTGSLHFTRPSPSDFARSLERLGVDGESVVVTYDTEAGLWASRLWWMLRSVGVPAAVLDGGWAAWLASGGSVARGPVAAEVGALPAGAGSALQLRERPELWSDRDDVEAVMDGRRPGVLVCALAPATFEGTEATRYSRRGHIPRSRNLPARSLLGANGRFLAGEALAGVLDDLDDASPVIAYCGGGILASLLALGLTLRGRDDVSVYDGSIEEWSADPELPLELGKAAD